MKKLIAVLALASVMLCAVACGSFPEIKDAKKNLKDENYFVDTTDDKDQIESFLSTFDADANGVEEVLIVEGADDIIAVVYCEDSKTANEIYEAFKDFYEDDFEDFAEKYGLDVDEYKVEKLGTTVVFGHEDLIEIAKGKK